MPKQIAIILPQKEFFSPQRFGAVALCVKDMCLHSSYRSSLHVYGVASSAQDSFKDIAYTRVSYHRPFYMSHTRAYCAALVQVFQKNPPALIEVHNRPLIAYYLQKHLSIPIALYLHNDPQEMRYTSFFTLKTPLQRTRLLKICSLVFCVSDYVRRRLLDGVSLPSTHVHTVYNGLDVQSLPRVLPRKKKQFVFAGRLIPQKGVLEFLQAFLRLRDSLPDWNVVLFGSFYKRHQDYNQHLKDLIRKLGHRLDFRGHAPHEDVLNSFLESEIAVLPSLWQEPFGRTILEAMACHCAVLTSSYGGLPEVIGDCGVLLPRDDSDTLASLMQRLATSSDRFTLQSRAYQRALSSFDIRLTTAQLDRLRDDFFQNIHHKRPL